MEEKIYTLREAAEILKTSERTLLRMLDSGRIVGFRHGTQWRFRQTEIDEYIEKQIKIATN